MMGNRYIYNRHIAPITANARDAKGRVLFTKTFLPEQVNATTGAVISTGYTILTDEEYKLLNESSMTFTVYRDKHKLLVEYDDMPAELKSPQEALVEARREARETARQFEEFQKEITKLKADLLDADKRYKDLFDASGGEGALKKLKDTIASLETSLAERTGERDAAATELAAVKKVLAEKIKK
jgi:chromosome segregation ATPase